MSSKTTYEAVRPVPRFLAVWSVACVGLAIALLALGGFVTSFRVGMADPVWPTEPWYLLDKDWSSLEFGFLIEHGHRLLGFLLGFAVTGLAVATWCYAPNRKLKQVGLASLVLLLVCYGQFHRGMGHVWDQIKTAASTQKLDPKRPDFEAALNERKLVTAAGEWPTISGVAAVAAAICLLACGWLAAASGDRRGAVAAAASLALVMVMAQGLLGGFRVLLNALAGGNLAAVHGIFGQLAFCTLVAVAVLSVARHTGDSLPRTERHRLRPMVWGLVAVTFLQLIWAVMLRHGGSGYAQRLHILTAFAVTAAILGLSIVVLWSATARPILARYAFVLIGLLVVQILLGVEAYIGKFTTTGVYAQLLPEYRPVTRLQAGIRTGHQLVGCGMLATAFALAMVTGRRSIVIPLAAAADHPVPDFAMMYLNVTATHAVSERTPVPDGAVPYVASMYVEQSLSKELPALDMPAPDIAKMYVREATK